MVENTIDPIHPHYDHDRPSVSVLSRRGSASRHSGDVLYLM